MGEPTIFDDSDFALELNMVMMAGDGRASALVGLEYIRVASINTNAHTSQPSGPAPTSRSFVVVISPEFRLLVVGFW